VNFLAGILTGLAERLLTKLWQWAADYIAKWWKKREISKEVDDQLDNYQKVRDDYKESAKKKELTPEKRKALRDAARNLIRG
jgi:hypothetical protein